MKLTLLVAFLLCFQWGEAQSIDFGSLWAKPDSVDWINIKTDSGTIHAAIALPPGKGPFPAMIILHGTHGFAREYIQLAQEFAKKGIVGIAACWFAGRKGEGQKFITPIDFNDAPPLVDAPGEDRFRIAGVTIDSLVRRVSSLSFVKTNHLALFGHSRGGGSALHYVLTHPGRVHALILNSVGYPPGVVNQSSKIDIPLFVLHGTADGNPGDGGSEFTKIEMAREFESWLRNARRDITVKYFEGSGHNALFSNSAQFHETVKLVHSFLLKKLSN